MKGRNDGLCITGFVADARLTWTCNWSRFRGCEWFRLRLGRIRPRKQAFAWQIKNSARAIAV